VKLLNFILLPQEQSNAQAWVEDAGGKAESVRLGKPSEVDGRMGGGDPGLHGWEVESLHPHPIPK